MMSLLLLMIGNIATALAPSGKLLFDKTSFLKKSLRAVTHTHNRFLVKSSGVNNLIDKNLDCTNDLMDSMSCCLKAQNCVEHSLTLIKEGK